MRLRAMAALVLLFSDFSGHAKPVRRWLVDLKQKYGLQGFDRGVSATWTRQQNLMFLEADRILVYQVNRTAERSQLAARGASGGAGNFLLDIRIFSAQDGQEIKSLRLTTNGGFSSVLAAQSGKFLVRCGDALFLYSASFEAIARKDLPLAKVAIIDGWEVAISPSREEVVLVHTQVFSQPQILMDGSVLSEGSARTDVEILDSSTLQLKKSFSLNHALPFWAAGDGVLISSDPTHSYSDGKIGILNYSGTWTLFTAEAKLEKGACPYRMNIVGHDLVAVFSCDNLLVLSLAGKKIFSRKDSRSSFASVAGNGVYLAVECDRYRIGRLTPGSGNSVVTIPDHIELHNIDTGVELMSVPVANENVRYAISTTGDLAVVDGAVLRVYGQEK